jgi:hypothetical protein
MYSASAQLAAAAAAIDDVDERRNISKSTPI